MYIYLLPKLRFVAPINILEYAGFSDKIIYSDGQPAKWKSTFLYFVRSIKPIHLKFTYLDMFLRVIITDQAWFESKIF